jgi:hypothetical protein
MDRFERAAEIRRLRAEGATLGAIGERFHISRTRVWKILKKPPRIRPSDTREAVLTDRALRSLFLGLDHLDLSVRVRNVLKREGMTRLGDVVGVPLQGLRRIKGLGRIAIAEIAELSAKCGLELGLDLPQWPPLVQRDRPSGWSREWTEQFTFVGSKRAVELLDASRLRQMLRLPPSGAPAPSGATSQAGAIGRPPSESEERDVRAPALLAETDEPGEAGHSVAAPSADTVRHEGAESTSENVSRATPPRPVSPLRPFPGPEALSQFAGRPRGTLRMIKRATQEGQLTVFVGWGELSPDEILGAYADFLRTGPTPLVLWDLSAATLTRMHTEDIHAFAERATQWHSVGRQGGKSALVVGSRDLQFGVARMLSTFLSLKGYPVKVETFRSRKEAQPWLFQQDA